MKTKVLSRWEQDGAGGEHGVLTLCFVSGDVQVPMCNFKEAHELQQAIQREMHEIRFDARLSLLNEIARIKP